MTGLKDPKIAQEIERIRQIYQDDVITRPCRKITLLGRKCSPKIIYTFLGFELKMGQLRLSCPDMGTARYLKVFAELGMKYISLPYDPSHSILLATGLEHAMDRIKEHLLASKLPPDIHSRTMRQIYRSIRKKLQA